ncbi:MAG TPA: hypothetical protein VKU02_06185, partial [Gemmataceae bacterium]|nr:hypothetical protein [Gemmataceae bacterium]
MAEDRFEPREINFRQWLPWTQIFRGFWVAIDPKKLLLAAGGILVMAFGWWLLATAFYSIKPKPVWPTHYSGGTKYEPKEGDPRTKDEIAFQAFRGDRDQWNLLYETAGSDRQQIEPGDLATTPAEFDLLQDALNDKTGARAKALALTVRPEEVARIQSLLTKDAPRVEPGSSKLTYLDKDKRHGDLRTWPWFEDRGPNPFLLVTARAPAWERGHFFDWLLREKVPVLIEPLVKFFRPIFYLLNPYTGFIEGLYFLLVVAWTVVTWAIFGGAITRMAAVEVARNDKLGLGEALRFVLARWRSYIFASFGPVLFLAGCAVLLILLFGIPNWASFVAEFWVGVLLPAALALGLAMAVIVIGLPGWPMIHATLGAEGSDSFDALSRCYSYVLQRPWSYIWYALVAIVYGAVVVFFVGFMGSLMIYFAKWGIGLVALKLGASYDRDPSYMFLWAPTSYGWRELLLQGSPLAEVSDPTLSLTHWWNYIGPSLVAIWLGIVFLMIIGFG